MIKATLFSVVVLFTLSACQGRSMPTHPSLPEPLSLKDLSDLKSKIKMPAFPNIPLVNKVIPTSSKQTKDRLKKKNFTHKSESFSGGRVSDGLDMGMVRLGQSSKYTRLIFDTYRWNEEELPTERMDHSGTYIFTYEPNEKRITAIIDGYRAFSALVGDQSELYKGNPIVQTIHLDEYLDNSGFKFVIELKQHVNVYVYELHNPGRIIVDMIPL